MSAHGDPIPPGVASEAQLVEAALGIEPTFEPLGKEVWRVTFENERVKVTFDHRDRMKGGIDQLDSTLTVDGKSRKLARDIEQLTAFFTDPTATLQSLRVEVVVPVQADIKQAPAAVQHFYGRLAFLLKNQDAAVFRASQPDKNTWVVGIYTDDRMLEIQFVRCGKRWGIINQPNLVLDGEDWSDEVQTLDEAMILFMGGNNSTPADNHQVVKPRGAQITPTSVQVRKTTVIRT